MPKLGLLGAPSGSLTFQVISVSEPPWIDKTGFSLYQYTFNIAGQGTVLLSIGKIYLLLIHTLQDKNIVLDTTFEPKGSTLQNNDSSMTKVCFHAPLVMRLCI